MFTEHFWLFLKNPQDLTVQPRFHFLHPLLPLPAIFSLRKLYLKQNRIKKLFKKEAWLVLHALFFIVTWDRLLCSCDDLQILCHPASCPATLVLPKTPGGMHCFSRPEMWSWAEKQLCTPKKQLNLAKGGREAGFKTCHFFQLWLLQKQRAGGLCGPEGSSLPQTACCHWGSSPKHTARWQKWGQSTARSLEQSWKPEASLQNKEKSCTKSSCYL